jgi:hypothetical protein
LNSYEVKTNKINYLKVILIHDKSINIRINYVTYTPLYDLHILMRYKLPIRVFELYLGFDCFDRFN